jgi:hypothetical protein
METATVPDGEPYLTRRQREMLKAKELHARVRDKPCPTCGKSRWHIRFRDGALRAYCGHCAPQAPVPATSAKKSDRQARVSLAQKKARVLLARHSAF